ncbi:MAG: iron-sulfur cluster carrier protein ApbC [Pseudomonadota bacterium]
MNQIKHIVAVASGKGGVGKSTTSVNIALAMAALGKRIGLLDADIYGPSQQMMLGVGSEQRPKQSVDGQHLLPIEVHGLESMSMGYLVSDKTPMVWRGPMAGGALAQLLEQTLWGELDVLIIDMPPGTGDVQLTLSQKAKVAGAVIVTTPQNIALLDAQKGIEMFRKVDIPVLGVIENMAVHICTACGHVEHIFGAEGGERIAADYGVPVLASLPLARSIREQTDAGQPPVIAEPESEVAGLYLKAAESILEALNKPGNGAVQQFPEIKITDD